MKRIICLLLTLCLLAGCSLAGAEDAASLGKPYANPNLMTAFTQQPGPEENYYLYVNYDGFVQATTGGHTYLASQEGRVYRALSIYRSGFAGRSDPEQPDHGSRKEREGRPGSPDVPY